MIELERETRLQGVWRVCSEQQTMRSGGRGRMRRMSRIRFRTRCKLMVDGYMLDEAILDLI